MRGIIINPTTKTVTEIEVTKGLQGLYAAMREADPSFSGTVELMRLNPGLDLWIDEEANLSAGRPVWHLVDAQVQLQPIAGGALLLANDGEGGSASLHHKITPELIKLLAHWSDLTTTGEFTTPSSEDTDGGFVIRTGQPIHAMPEGEKIA